MLGAPKVEIKEGILLLNCKQVSLPRKVDQVIVLEDKIIYRFFVNGKDVTNRNIGALDFDGNKKWIIEEVDSKALFKEYDDMYLNETGELIACCYIGMDFIVNTLDGAIVSYKFRKF